MSGGHGHDLGHEGGSQNKKIAMLIAVLALVLAISETLGKGAQTDALTHNVEASNLWAFFQAKTIRMTTLRTAAGPRRLSSRHWPTPPFGPRWRNESATGKAQRPVTTRSRRRRRGARSWRPGESFRGGPRGRRHRLLRDRARRAHRRPPVLRRGA
jgi:Domain of unknown function (DUF4337)